MIKEEERVNKRVVEYLVDKKNIFYILNRICQKIKIPQDIVIASKVMEILHLISYCSTSSNARYIATFTENCEYIMKVLDQVLGSDNPDFDV